VFKQFEAEDKGGKFDAQTQKDGRHFVHTASFPVYLFIHAVSFGKFILYELEQI
jgi:hypothetical protein